jgi:hypothetical protein
VEYAVELQASIGFSFFVMLNDPVILSVHHMHIGVVISSQSFTT